MHLDTGFGISRLGNLIKKYPFISLLASTPVAASVVFIAAAQHIPLGADGPIQATPILWQSPGNEAAVNGFTQNARLAAGRWIGEAGLSGRLASITSGKFSTDNNPNRTSVSLSYGQGGVVTVEADAPDSSEASNRNETTSLTASWQIVNPAIVQRLDTVASQNNEEGLEKNITAILNNTKIKLGLYGASVVVGGTESNINLGLWPGRPGQAYGVGDTELPNSGLPLAMLTEQIYNNTAPIDNGIAA